MVTCYISLRVAKVSEELIRGYHWCLDASSAAWPSSSSRPEKYDNQSSSSFIHSFSTTYFFTCILTSWTAALHQQLRLAPLAELLIMRLPRNPAQAAILSSILSSIIFPFVSANVPLNCAHVRADSTDFTFEPLGGPRSVLHSVSNSASWTNTTYTIDLCTALKRKNDVPEDQKCPGGTRCKLPGQTAHGLCRSRRSANQNQYAVSSA
jgi:hypothetical protein